MSLRFVLLFVIFIAVHSVSFSQSYTDRIPVFANGKWGFCDTSGAIIIESKYLKVMPFFGSFAAVMDTFAYWGFIDKNGVEIIKPKYEVAEGFSHGLCRIKLNEKYGFLNTNLKEVVPPVVTESCDDMGRLLSRSGIAICGKIVADTSGKYFTAEKYEKYGDFSEGLLWVEKNYKGGFVNSVFEEVIPLGNFTEGESKPAFVNGMCGLKIKGNFGYINTSGQPVSEFKYDSGLPFSEGKAVVSKDWKYGFIDKSGKEIVPLEYDYAQSFTEGMAVVVKSDKYGFINESLKLVIPCQFHRAYNFYRGHSMALHFTKYFIIDKKGKKVSKEYEFMSFVTKGAFYQVMNKKKYGVVSFDGKELVPCIYKDVTYYNYDLDIGIVQNTDGKYGMLNSKGKFIIPCIYDFLEMRAGNIIYAELMNIDGKGKEVRMVFVGDKYYDRAFLQQGFFDIKGKKYFK